MSVPRMTEAELLAYQSRPKDRSVSTLKPIPRRGRMNKLEARYASEVLDVGKHMGTVIDYWFEPIRFRLAKSTNYTGDFVVQTPNGWELHEVKGFKYQAAQVRLKVAAEMEPFKRMFKFYLCRHPKGEWQIERVGE